MFSENLKTARVNGQEFRYIEQGSGAGLVFVHGSMGDYRAWHTQMDAFSPAFRTVAYSRRYHYPNAWNGDGLDYTVGLHADDLIALVQALNLAPARAVGNSFGAYTVLVAALRRPDLFQKIAVGEPPILPWLKEIPGGQPYWDGFMEKAWLPAGKAFQAGQAEQGFRLFVDGVFGPGGFERLPDATRDRFLQNTREMTAETSAPDYFTPVDPRQVGQLQVPMLLLKAENSPRMFHLIVDRLSASAPQAQLAVIPSSSHSMPSNNPAAYNQAVMSFLNGG